MRVLGIVRSSGEYVGAPSGGTRVEVGDTLVVYGRRSDVADVADRPAGRAGDEAHRYAVADRRTVAGEGDRSREIDARIDVRAS